MTRIAILGGGHWGSALALIAGRGGYEVTVWARNARTVESIERGRFSPHLSGYALPETVGATTNIPAAVSGRELVILAVPSHAVRPVLQLVSGQLDPSSLIISAAKGIEDDTLLRMSEVAVQVIGSAVADRFVALSGPSFAHEAAADQPTAVSAASTNLAAANTVQTTFSQGNFRVYTSEDVIGTELGGAVKNVIAIAAGMVHGLGLGHNSVAALVTRGLAEIARLSDALGARRETLTGLAGLGDLLLTCTGDRSRNRRVGIELGRGAKLNDILADMSEVAEGVRTTKAVHSLALRDGIDMPITAQVFRVLYEELPAKVAVTELMDRPLRAEF